MSCYSQFLNGIPISFKQLPRLIIRFGRGDDGNVHASDLFDLVIFDLRKDDLFFQSKGKIPSAVKRFRRNPPEIADTRKSDIDQPVEEFDTSAPVSG